MPNRITSGLQARANELDEQQRVQDETFARQSAAQDYVNLRNLGNEVFVYRASPVDENGQVILTLQTDRDKFHQVPVPNEDLSQYTESYNYYETQFRQNRNELAGMRNYYSTVLSQPNTRPEQAQAIENLWRTGNLDSVKQSNQVLYSDWRDHVQELEDPSSRANLFRSGLIADRAFAREAYDKPFNRFLAQQEAERNAKVNEIVGLLDGRQDISTTNEQLKGTIIPAAIQRQNQQRANLFIAKTNESIRSAIAANVGKTASSATTTGVDENAFGSESSQQARNIADKANSLFEDGIARFSRNDSFTPPVVVAASDSAQPVRDTPIRSNPLEDSTSYTYAFTIFVLTKDEVNQLAENAGVFQPKTVIISTAGRHNNVEAPQSAVEMATFGAIRNDQGKLMAQSGKVARAAEWADDFFIDELKLMQILAPNSQGRTSNTLDIEFTLIEPYGLSLLNRLIDTARRLKEKTYTHLCYLLQIDFYNENGLMSEHSKRIPMQFTNMNIKVSSKGSEYRITALPFSHQAMLDSYGSTPANFEVSGATLREFFKDDEPSGNDRNALFAGATQIRKELESDAVNSNSAYTGVREISNDALVEGIRALTFKVNSYVGAFNGYNRMLHDLNILDKKIPPSKIRVRFHDDIIAKEKITQPSKDTTVAKNPTINKDTYNPGTNVNPNQEAKNWVMSAGTSVVEVINQAMMNSDYVRGQILLATKGEENKQAQREGVVNWWRVLPSVKIIGYDESTQRWSFETTFFVLPYKVYNTRHRHLPMSKVSRAQCVKEYNYLYTGQNTNVIDFQVEFNMLYLTIASGMLENNIDDPQRFRAGSTDVAEQSKPALDNRNNRNNNDTYFQVQAFPATTHVVTENRPELTNKGLERDPIAAALAAVADSIYTKSTGDMLNATLKIIGDPHLIKQDDVYFNPAMFYKESNRNTGKGTDGIQLPPEWSPTADVSRALANNSLIMDAGHVLAYVEIRNPADIDEKTGGSRKYNNAGDYSAFTGVFFIYEVTSEFKNGAFTQSLELIRYQQQDSDILYSGLESRTVEGLDLIGKNARSVSELAPDSGEGFNNSALVTFPISQDSEDVT